MMLLLLDNFLYTNLLYSHLLALGGVAHRLEQAAHNRLVVGSTPTAPTTIPRQALTES